MKTAIRAIRSRFAIIKTTFALCLVPLSLCMFPLGYPLAVFPIAILAAWILNQED